MSTTPKIFKSDPIWHDNGKLKINLVQFKSSLHAQRWSPFVKVLVCCLLNHVIHLTWNDDFCNWMTIFCQIDFEKKEVRFCLEKIVISSKKCHMIQKTTGSDFDKWWPQSVTIKSDFTRAARALCNESQNEILAFPRTMPFQGGHYLLWLLKLRNVSSTYHVNKGNYFE